MPGPMDPEEYGETLSDDELEAAGYASGLDVWEPVIKAYEAVLNDPGLTNVQLWSLREAIRAELLDELGHPGMSEPTR